MTLTVMKLFRYYYIAAIALYEIKKKLLILVEIHSLVIIYDVKALFCFDISSLL